MHRFLGVLVTGLLFAGAVWTLERVVPDAFLLTSAKWLIYGMVIPATGFPLLYLTFYRWYRDPIGRALMLLAIGMLLLIDFSAYFALTQGQYGWAAEVQFLVFVLVCGGLWYEFLTFLKVRIHAKREKRRQQREAAAAHSNSD